MTTALEAATARLTLEEFLALPEPADGSKLEYWNGEVVVMPPPGYDHGAIAFEIALQLGMFLRSLRVGGQLLTNDSGFSFNNTVLGPDIAWVRAERLPSGRHPRHFDGPPDLAIEVVSPSDLDTRVAEKVALYLAAGVARVWVVRPDQQTVTVRGEGLPILELSGEDLLTSEHAGFPVEGFALSVASLFAPAAS